MSATTVRLWEIEDRGTSIKFSTAPPGREGRTVFIGRAVIEHISRGAAKPGEPRPCEVKLPDWLIEREGL